MEEDNGLAAKRKQCRDCFIFVLVLINLTVKSQASQSWLNILGKNYAFKPSACKPCRCPLDNPLELKCLLQIFLYDTKFIKKTTITNHIHQQWSQLHATKLFLTTLPKPQLFNQELPLTSQFLVNIWKTYTIPISDLGFEFEPNRIGGPYLLGQNMKYRD